MHERGTGPALEHAAVRLTEAPQSQGRYGELVEQVAGEARERRAGIHQRRAHPLAGTRARDVLDLEIDPEASDIRRHDDPPPRASRDTRFARPASPVRT